MNEQITFWSQQNVQWQALASKVHQQVARIDAMVDRDARNTARRAGLDSQICYLHAHNAMCSFDAGRPWPECDYSLVRRVLWLEGRRFDASRKGDRIIARAFNRLLAAPFNLAKMEVR
jgi:hypothetical protein